MTPGTLLTRRRAAIFALLYAAVIVYLSLYPGEFLLFPRADRLLWVRLIGRRAILDAVLNVFFYVPLGATTFRAAGGGWAGWIAALLGGGILSLTVEWLQLWSPVRYGTLTDLTANTLGAAVGACLSQIAARSAWLGQLSGSTSRWRLPADAQLLLVLWILWQGFPFVPVIGLPRLVQMLEWMEPWSWRTAAEIAIGFAVVRMALGKSPWLWAAYAMLPAQAFLLEQFLSPSALLGAAVGWIAAARAGLRPAHFSLLLPLWLVFEELRPFQFISPAMPFVWAPFHTWYETPSAGYYPIIFGKLFLYTATVWALRARGMVAAVGLPVAILTVGEWMQRFIPGRTPESTDIVLVVGGAILLALWR